MKKKKTQNARLPSQEPPYPNNPFATIQNYPKLTFVLWMKIPRVLTLSSLEIDSFSWWPVRGEPLWEIEPQRAHLICQTLSKHTSAVRRRGFLLFLFAVCESKEWDVRENFRRCLAPERKKKIITVSSANTKAIAHCRKTHTLRCVRVR